MNWKTADFRDRKKSTDSMLLPSTEMMLFGAGPEPRFCSLVLAYKMFKPGGAAASVKLDNLALASSADGRTSVVSSAYTRSVKLEAPA